jgi:hypothetical protein
MAETQQPTSSSDAGNVTVSYSKAQRARGVSAVPAVNPKINQDEFVSALDELVGVWKVQNGCSVGRITNELPEPARTKFKEAFNIAVGSDVMRRHRRRLFGKDGCKCPIEH